MTAAKSEPYIPLASLLEFRWEKPRSELPAEVVLRLEDAFFPLTWDKYADVEWRQTIVAIYDAQRDPAQRVVMQAAFRLTSIKDEIEEAESANANTPRLEDVMIRRLNKLNLEQIDLEKIVGEAGRPSNISAQAKLPDGDRGAGLFAQVDKMPSIENGLFRLSKIEAIEAAEFPSIKGNATVTEVGPEAPKLESAGAVQVVPMEARAMVLPAQSAAPLQWIATARKLGEEIAKAKSRKNLHAIAELVRTKMLEFKEEGDSTVSGRGGRVPQASTIKREALTGIKRK